MDVLGMFHIIFLHILSVSLFIPIGGVGIVEGVVYVQRVPEERGCEWSRLNVA